jgi:hypothetical protein
MIKSHVLYQLSYGLIEARPRIARTLVGMSGRVNSSIPPFPRSKRAERHDRPRVLDTVEALN